MAAIPQPCRARPHPRPAQPIPQMVPKQKPQRRGRRHRQAHDGKLCRHRHRLGISGRLRRLPRGAGRVFRRPDGGNEPAPQRHRRHPPAVGVDYGDFLKRAGSQALRAPVLLGSHRWPMGAAHPPQLHHGSHQQQQPPARQVQRPAHQNRPHFQTAIDGQRRGDGRP